MGDRKRVKKSVSCSATVSNMSEMLTLIKSWFFFCHKLHMSVQFLFSHAMKKKKQVSASNDELKVKHKEKYFPYHLWTNFIIMSLEDERGRGELNVKGDKGIKNTFSTGQKCQSLKMWTYYASTYTIYDVIRVSCFKYSFDRGDLAIS